MSSKNDNNKVRIAIAGVGNCASALLQGIEFYRRDSPDAWLGLMHQKIGGYEIGDITPVAAFDVDARKVGTPLHRAMFAPPNCTTVFHESVPDYGVTVQMGPVLDGVTAHMSQYPGHRAFRVADARPVDLTAALKESGAEVLLSYLPVGSEAAVHAYADACLAAGVAMVNCVPVFIASNPEYANRFRARGLPVVGDDIKSQLGATILHRALARLMGNRGIRMDRTYQLNTGGNTDFLNMLDRTRLRSKKESKTESVQAELDMRLPDDEIHIGPADYVPWQKDNKICFIRIEAKGFGGVPMNLECRLSVEDSPNSAGVVVDAARCAKLALDRGISGPLIPVSAYYMKHPPQQITDTKARQALEEFLMEA
ncbi:MAG: inositol-3-phosphate synthase, partial [Acidobacteriota bacterium]